MARCHNRGFACLAEPNETARDFFYMLLFTGARRGNVLAMRWKDISLKQALWRIPETKNGEPLSVHLPEPALDILRRRQSEAGKAEYVFPGNGSKGHYQDPKKAWQRILQRAELEDLRIHDLRRTLGSYQAVLGANAYVIGKSLGHKSQEATAIYARLHLDPVRESVNKALEHMLQFNEPNA